jgi:hypothetical protein
MTHRHRHTALSMVWLLMAACDDAEPRATPDDAPDGGSRAETRFVVATNVTSDEGDMTYVKVMDELETGDLDLSDAREFAGVSDLKVSAGKLFMSSGEDPTVARFEVGRDGMLVEAGTIDFSNYTDNATMAGHVFIDEDTAYLVGVANEYIVWSPRTLEITGTIPFPEIPARDGIPAAPGRDIGMIVRDGLLFHTFPFSDYEEFEMADSSLIVITDVAKNEVVQMIEAPCPDLNVASMDSQGNLYFSSWVYAAAATLVNDAAKACAIKIPAGEQAIDEAWTVTFEELVGHEAAALRILSNDTAIISVFDDTHQPFDPEKDNVYEWVFGANWKATAFDLKTQTTADIEGVDWNSGGFYVCPVDGTDYLLNPGDGYQTTQFYRLDKAGRATLTLESKGWATRLYEVP